MTKTNNQTGHTAVIPQAHKDKFCDEQGSGRYTNNWIFGWPCKANSSEFIKTQAERNQLKRIR